MGIILSDIASQVKAKINSSKLSVEQYVTTDSLLPNKQGREIASKLPSSPGSCTRFEPGDVLVGNIRPYLKKIWYADCAGGCSNDVLVFRANNECDSAFLYSQLLNDTFFNYVMLAPKGAKMPRGEVSHILRYPIQDIDGKNRVSIGSFIKAISQKIDNLNLQNGTLESLARQIYDYWFLQYEFPTVGSKTYKSSGGRMVYNSELKREIPEKWEVNNLPHIALFTNGLACQKYRPKGKDKGLPVIKISDMHERRLSLTEFVKSDIPEKVKVYNGDILFSWSASLEVMLWAYGTGGLNQHIFKVTTKNGFPKYYVYFQLLNYVQNFRRIAEARKTTMGHITSDHLNQSIIAIPSDKKICEAFNERVSPIFDKIIKNNQTIKELTSFRDFVLPLLMNGQATIEE